MHATFGDNSRNLSPAEAKALFFHHFSKIAAQHERLEQERSEEKRLRKLAKAEDGEG